MPEVGMQNFSIQGLSDVLTSLDTEATVMQPLAEEYTLLLEVTMAVQPGHPWIPNSHPRGRPPKQFPAKNSAGNLPPSSLDRDGVDSDGYCTMSKTPRSHHHSRRRCGEKWLAPVQLDMPILKLTDPNTDVTYTLWRFDVQGWLDQYQEESMMPHIYNSLRGYPGRWVCSLGGGQNMTMTELLEQMDHAFGDVQEYDTMICSLYEIRQKEGESVEEYML